MHQSKRQIRNLGSVDMTVIIEPHGDVLSLVPGGSLEIVAESPTEGEIELVSTSPQSITIYTWPSSTCKVYQGSTVVRDYPFPVPGVPDGVTTRAFVDRMFNRGTQGFVSDSEDE